MGIALQTYYFIIQTLNSCSQNTHILSFQSLKSVFQNTRADFFYDTCKYRYVHALRAIYGHSD